MITGTIFDIRRFSTHDGAGIRTTVFLKGCPLRCVWCQNPEGISSHIGPVYFEDKCMHCNTCLHMAGQGEVQEMDGKIHRHKKQSNSMHHSNDPNSNDIHNPSNLTSRSNRGNFINSWPAIAAACPSGAIVMDSRSYEAEELVEEVMKDEVFFRMGGGVTLSGGEPLWQPEFVLEVLKLFRNKGIHTAMETSLYASAEWIQEILPYVDCLYADMKLADEHKHKEYTGVHPALMKRNIRYVLTSPCKKNAIIRTPLIPEYTATKENLTAIARFLSEIDPDVVYELLNYNPLAAAKYHLADRPYCYKNNPSLYTKEQMKQFGELVKANGIRNLIMEI